LLLLVFSPSLVYLNRRDSKQFSCFKNINHTTDVYLMINTPPKQFVKTLQHKKSSVQELGIYGNHFRTMYYDEDKAIATRAIFDISLARNEQLNRVNELLAPPARLRHRPSIAATTTSTTTTSIATMWMKTCHKAIAKFAMVPNKAGASAIFQLFTARPQLLEKRLKPPPAAAAATVLSQRTRISLPHDAVHVRSMGGGRGANINSLERAATSSIDGQQQKRRRLLLPP
jgi:hypothetical protein